MVKPFRILTIFLLLCATVAYAQPRAAKTAATPAAAPVPAPAGLTPEEMNRPFKGSFFLSPLEIAAIQQALSGRVESQQTIEGENKAVIPAHRVIRISGVLYRTPSDWVVWMNNQKVTPANLLPEIVDISVRDSSKVSLQWYDVGLNQVLSLTLRPDQTYDITTGVLLPGSH